MNYPIQDGRFKIPMVASLPKPQLKLPETLNFGMCAVKDQVVMKFEISNIRFVNHIVYNLWANTFSNPRIKTLKQPLALDIVLVSILLKLNR